MNIPPSPRHDAAVRHSGILGGVAAAAGAAVVLLLWGAPLQQALVGAGVGLAAACLVALILSRREAAVRVGQGSGRVVTPRPEQAGNPGAAPSQALSLIAPDDERLRELLDRLPVGVVLIDPNLVAQYWSARCESLFGWKADEIVGRPIVQTFSRGLERGVERIRDKVSAHLDAGTLGVVDSQSQIRTRGGAILMCHFTTIGLADAKGLVGGFLTVAQDVTAQVTAENALRESERHYRALFETHPQPMWIVDATNLRFLAVNEAATLSYGWSREEFASLPLDRIATPEELAELTEFGREFGAPGLPGAASGSQRNGPWQHRLRDGRVIAVECASQGLVMNGVPARLTSCFDVTARERALAELRASEQRLQTLTDNLPVGVFRADAQGRCQFVNRKWIEMSGIPLDEALGGGWLRSVPPEDLDSMQRLWFQAVERGETGRMEHRLRHVDGRVLWVQGDAHPLRGPDGSVTGFVGSTVDLSERHAVEAELRVAAAAFEQQEGIVVADVNSIVLRVNRTFCEITGYAEEEVVGRSTKFLRSGRHEDSFYRARREQIATRGHWSGEAWNRRKNGEIYPEWVNVTAVRNPEGRVTHYVGSYLDITERKRAESALLESQRELGQLTRRLMDQEKQTTSRLAQALHDCLGQTLGALRLHTDALEAQHLAGKLALAASTSLPRVRSLVDQAVQEVRGVLFDLRPPLLDQLGLVAALDNELQVRRRDAGEVELKLQLREARPTWRWPADVEYAAFMIAREAIVNALKHAGATRITCSLAGEALHLNLRVEDDGGGLPGPTERPGHLGVVGMRERALAIGAVFDLQSAGGAGVVVEVDWRAAA